MDSEKNVSKKGFLKPNNFHELYPQPPKTLKLVQKVKILMTIKQKDITIKQQRYMQKDKKTEP